MPTPITTLAAVPVDARSFVRLSPFIRSELRRLAVAGALSASVALRHVFTHLFGSERSHDDQLRFMLFAAPIARRIAIELADSGDLIGDTDIKVSDVKEWLGWLDAFDPVCARMIDLHYFAGLTTRETAFVLKMSPRAVVRDLRFAKAWLRTKLL